MANKFGSQTVTALKVGSHDVTRIFHGTTVLYGEDYIQPDRKKDVVTYTYNEAAKTITITITKPSEKTQRRLSQGRLGVALWCKDVQKVGKMLRLTDYTYNNRLDEPAEDSLRGLCRPYMHTVKQQIMSSYSTTIDLSDLEMDFAHGMRREEMTTGFINCQVAVYIQPEGQSQASRIRYVSEYARSQIFKYNIN